MTGAGMMDCKKALNEAEGDFDKAIQVLRKKGEKMAGKRADREATEGVVIAKVSEDKTKGVIIKIGCETDFVAKNEDFIRLAERFAQIALDTMPADSDKLLNTTFEDGITIGEKLTEQIGVIGEKLELAAYETLTAEMIAPYIHMGHKAAVLVALNKASDEIYKAGRDVAMQVAAMKPIAVDKDGIKQALIDTEIEIGKEQALREGKPEKMIEKIALGKLNKFFKENTLLNQQFVKDNKKSVSDYLKSIDSDLTVTDFKHVTLG